MTLLYTFFFFVLGLVFGSFYNVVGYRLPFGKSLITPGSECPKCHHRLKWYELIPVISFLIQRGKCTLCGEKISKFYPLMELLTGLLFALSFYLFGFSYDLLLLLAIASLFVIVIVSDVNFLMIPDEVTIVGSILIIVINILNLGLKDAILMFGSGVFLFLVMFLIMKLGNKLLKKESLGGADIKLMFLVGLVLNPIEGMFCIFLSSLLALPISLILLWKNKDNVIPYGPFILLALLLILIFNFDLNFLLGIC